MDDKTVSFTRMDEGTREDYQLLAELEHGYVAMTADRVIAQLALQATETLSGYKINRLEHGLQSAARAEYDGADIDWIVAALIHDIGDGLAPQNHDRMAAEVIRPFVREEVSWVVEKHGIFQMKYYGHHYGWDPDKRDEFRDNPYWQSCADFCERWDQTSFDPDYPMPGLNIMNQWCAKSLAARHGMKLISSPVLLLACLPTSILDPERSTDIPCA